MPGFRWELQQDIALASEVATSHPQKLQDWDKIAVTLSAAFSPDEKPVQLKARGCRERMDLLLNPCLLHRCSKSRSRYFPVRQLTLQVPSDHTYGQNISVKMPV